MNKRNSNLLALLVLMAAIAAALCACMLQEQPPTSEDASQTTTDLGYGVVDLEDEPTEADSDNKQIIDETKPTLENTDVPDSTVETTIAPTTDTTTPTVNYQPGSLTFEEYLKLSGSEQQTYALAFPSIGDYIVWYNTEKEKYENNSAIEITGPIDLGEIAGKNE